METGPHRAATPALMTTLSGATLLASLGISIATIALPTLARTFPVTLAELQWVILAYLLSMTVTIVSAGRLGDLYGPRRVLLLGLALFTAASILCAVSPNLAVLIAGRALQGVGGAIITALPMSIARDAVPEDRMGAAMGLLGTMSAAGTALGPSLGGILMAHLGWQAAFFLLATGGAAIVMIALRALPAGRPGVEPKPRMDWLGTSLLALALGFYALAATGSGTAMLLLPATLVFVVFLRVQMRAPSPLIPLSLVRGRFIGTGLAMNLLLGTVMMSTLVVGPFFLSFALGLDETLTGLVMAVGPVTAAFAGAPAGRIVDRLGTDRARLLGLVETIAGFLCLALLPRWLGMAGYVGALIVLTPGFQLFLAANNASVMVAAPAAQRGVLSGLLGLSRNLGLLTGASVMATIFTALLGTGQIAEASTAGIGTAFTASFLISAGLTAVAMALALLGRRSAVPAA